MATPATGFGQKINQATITTDFLTGPGQDLVAKFLMQLSSVKGFATLFGPYKMTADGEKATDQQRWADYQRMDWSIRQLPAINAFEGQTENKDSDNAFLTGSMTIQIFWPPNFRRSDLARVPAAIKGALQNFFASSYVDDMLDELASIQRPMKVAGLNEFGKTMTWSPNVEGIIEQEAVPATIVDVGYRIDLRAWYRALEFQNRTQADPFDATLADLTGIEAEILGVKDLDPNAVIITVPEQNP